MVVKLLKKYVAKWSEKWRRSKLPMEAQSRYDRVDELESDLAKMEQFHFPVQDVFTPGLYTRIITMPKGSFLTSEIHKTEHPFLIMKGKVEVANVETGEVVIYEAPHVGITKPYTRRVLNVIEDTVWATSHVTKETDVEKIGDKILVQRDNVVPQYKLKHKKENIWLGQQ